MMREQHNPSFIDIIRSGDYEKNDDESLYSNIAKTSDESLRTGKWSKEEDDVLIKNWNLFLNDYPWIIGNQMYIFMSKKCEYYHEIISFIRKSHLYDRLANNIKRGVKNVYWRAKKCLLVKNLYKTEPISEIEIEKALKLYQTHGPQYSLIAQNLERRPDYIRAIIQKNINNTNNSLQWSQYEEKCLLLSVLKIKYPKTYKKYAKNCEPLSDKTKINFVKLVADDFICLGECEYGNFPWTDLSQVLCRSNYQCREHWLLSMLPKIQHSIDCLIDALNNFINEKDEVSAIMPNYSGSSSDFDSDGFLSLTNKRKVKDKLSIKSENGTMPSNAIANTSSATSLDKSFRVFRAQNKDLRIQIILALKQSRKLYPYEKDIDWYHILGLIKACKPNDLHLLKSLYRKAKNNLLKSGTLLKSKSWNTFCETPQANLILNIARNLSFEDFKSLPDHVKAQLTRTWTYEVLPFKKLIKKICKKYERAIEVYEMRQTQDSEVIIDGDDISILL